MAERNENSPLDSDKWIKVPFDVNKRLNLFFDHADRTVNKVNIKIRPRFSLLLVVDNDASTVAETLDSLLAQDYRYYEVIIIDNASTDGSGEICQQKIASRENVTFKRLYSKVKNAEAWNMALNMTWGGVIMFPSSRATTDSFPMLSPLYTSHMEIKIEILFTRLRHSKKTPLAILLSGIRNALHNVTDSFS